MNKLILLGSFLFLTACATPQNNFMQLCRACMTKTQFAEGAVRACPKQVTINRSEGYKVFSNMSKSVNKADHENWVDMFRQAHKIDGCSAVVNKIKSAAPSYEFLKLR